MYNMVQVVMLKFPLITVHGPFLGLDLFATLGTSCLVNLTTLVRLCLGACIALVSSFSTSLTMVFLAAQGPAATAVDFACCSDWLLCAAWLVASLVACMRPMTACKACACFVADTSRLVASLADTSDPFWPAVQAYMLKLCLEVFVYEW